MTEPVADNTALDDSFASPPVQVLPDGSAFCIASFPLPKGHWLYERDADGFIGDPPSGTTRDAARWAVRAATGAGSITDFDPDAMVLNFLYALRFVAGDGASSRPLAEGDAVPGAVGDRRAKPLTTPDATDGETP